MAGGAPIAREGDLFGMGGIVTGHSSPNVTVNGKPVALHLSIYTPHICCPFTKACLIHCFGVVFGKSAGVTVNGEVPLVVGSSGICGHTVGSGSPNVIIIGAEGGGLAGGLLGAVAGAGLGAAVGALGAAGTAAGYSAGFKPGSVGSVPGTI